MVWSGFLLRFFPALRFYPRRVFLIVGFSRRVCGPTPLNMFVWPPLKCCNVCGDVCVCVCGVAACTMNFNYVVTCVCGVCGSVHNEL